MRPEKAEILQDLRKNLKRSPSHQSLASGFSSCRKPSMV